MNRTALILGSEGFIGRHVTNRLTEMGWDLHLVDIRSGIDADTYLWEQHDEEAEYDLVVHVAAKVGGRLGIERKALDIASNYALDYSVLSWAEQYRPKRLLLFSSSAAYPIRLQTKLAGQRLLVESDIDLNVIAQPDAEYGQTKLALERQAWVLRELGVRVTVVRPFSGMGWDQDLDYPYPSFLQRALRGDDPFTIWGAGSQVRDFIHISDLVEAALVACERNVTGPVNICTGRPTSFNELATLICREVDLRPRFERLKDKPSGVHYRVGDPTQMLKLYRPKLMLEQAIRQDLAAMEAADG